MLKLNNGFFLESDETQFILKQNYTIKKKDTGEEKESTRVLGYYAELKQALNGYINQLALNKTYAEDLTAKELFDYLKQEKEKVNEI